MTMNELMARGKALPAWLKADLERRWERMAEVHEDDAPFLSDVNAAVLMGARRSSHVILWASALFFLIALIWASFATLDEVTTGEGKVIPSAKLQVIQNLEGGILSELYVKEGQTVAKDQALMRLDDTRFDSNFRENEVKYLSLLAKAARLKAEVEQQPYKAPDEVMKNHPEIAQNEQMLYTSRQSELKSGVQVLQDQLLQAQQQLSETRSHRDQLERSYGLLRRELAMSEPLATSGAISEVELLRLRRNVNDLKGDMDASTLAIPRLEASISEVNRKIDELKITFRTKSQTELNETQADLSALSESLRSDKDRVTRTLIRSPVRGIVKQLKVTTIGGIVQPGMDMAEIVPLDGTLLVEARIRPKDIAFLHPGQQATVKLTAYDFSIYGGMNAKLEMISADTITDEKGQSFYVIRVRTDRDFLGSKSKALKIIPGMTVVVDILTGHKSVLDYLLKPILKARERGLRER
jgi:membrane fusion protein, adhesin transport system